MAEFHETHADGSSTPEINLAPSMATAGPDQETEDAYWQSAYPERPYARADRGYEYYRSAYRYGTERATQWRERDWASAERALRDGWLQMSGGDLSSWEEMRDAVRDAWDRVRGRSADDRTHIR
jgi:hypothetical protein